MSSCCEESPTNAHHWVLDLSNRGQCKYCGGERQFHHPNPYEMSPYVGKPKETIHRIMVKAQGVLLDPYTGEDCE